jgi:predicted nucleic-acid-binding Zn-ribbon protein
MTIPILTDEIKDIAQLYFDSLLQPYADGGFSKPCLLYYPPIQVACTNCAGRPVGAPNSSINVKGGPTYSPVGAQCPACNGRATIEEQITETVYLHCSQLTAQNKKYLNIDVNVNLPDGSLIAKGFLSDMPKVQRADYILVNTEILGYMERKYKLASEIVSPSNIVQNRYFYVALQRTL